MYKVVSRYTREFVEYWAVDGRIMGGTRWCELDTFATETEAIIQCCRYQDS